MKQFSTLRAAVVVALVAGAMSVQAVPIGTVTVESDVVGTKVKIPVALDLHVATAPTGIALSVEAQLDMSDLQLKFDGILKAIPVPRDNCPGYGQHLLPTVEAASLRPAGTTAVLNAKANVVIWDCQKGAPLAGTTVRWETRCVNVFGGRICTDVPVSVEPKPGPDIKNVLLREGFEGTAGLLLSTADGKSIELRPVGVSVNPRGDVGKFFNSIAGFFNASLSDLVQREVREILDAGVLRRTLPSDVASFNPVIRSAQFVTLPGEKLGAKVTFDALLTPQQLEGWMQASIGKVGK